jgi:DNA mismatch repair protein MutS
VIDYLVKRHSGESVIPEIRNRGSSVVKDTGSSIKTFEDDGARRGDDWRAPRTLFATHYFELTQLAEKLPGVFNAHATAKEWPGPDGRKQVVFLYQIMPGPADRSYGIHVAEMAGLPSSCIDEAREILHQLEVGGHDLSKASSGAPTKNQLEFFGEHPLVDELNNLRLDEMTPLEALNKLAEFKKKIK